MNKRKSVESDNKKSKKITINTKTKRFILTMMEKKL